MSSLKKNVIATFGSNVFVALMNFIFVPLYIHFMGIESYGLVGVFSTLLALFALLDMGLGSTLNREFARLGAQNNKGRDMRDLLRTLEVPYWLVALLIGIGVVVFSPILAHHWFNPKTLSATDVQRAVAAMGIAIAFQWPFSFYSGGLMGRHRQVTLGILNAILAAFRGMGAVLVLWLFSPTVEAFFGWQIVVSATGTGLAAFCLWRSLPEAERKPRFRKDLMKKIWRFAAGVTGITLLGTILTQMDTIILSRMLSLETLGYYSLARTVANILFRFFGPIFSSTYPLLTHFHELRQEKELTKLYHKSCQLVAVLTLPAALLICFFSPELLFLWTHDRVTVENTHLLVSVLVIGTAFNGLMTIPYALQLASGWTKLNFFVNLCSVSVLLPSTILLTKWYGPVGAASNWVLVNGAYILVIIPLMHRRLLKKEMGAWYGWDVLAPLMGAAAMVLVARWVYPWGQAGLVLQLLGLGTIGVLATLAATFLAPAVRQSALNHAAKLRSLWIG